MRSKPKRKSKNLVRITIPAGEEDGQTIKITGHGGPGVNNGPDGDLYISFKILNNTSFGREKDNLYKSVEIRFTTAILGGEITTETLSGKVKSSVKSETQNGTKVKLTRKGLPKYKKEGQFGDPFITYRLRYLLNLPKGKKNFLRYWQ
ncbi:DnaJ C-terminal domain-containing protein [Maribacter halichondriae]|uniref:DnaJ C-terminal domain-containing protein n=1 Tax=Maribacter halichondriae TaxID=2980554 RepID=UPI00307625B0